MPGDCHYLEGNANARRRIDHLKGILDEISLGGERLHMYNMSAAMAGEFVEAAIEMDALIEDLGPNPLRSRPSEVTVEDQGELS